MIDATTALAHAFVHDELPQEIWDIVRSVISTPRKSIALQRIKADMSSPTLRFRVTRLWVRETYAARQTVRVPMLRYAMSKGAALSPLQIAELL